MTHIAATLITLIIIATLVYGASCLVWPFRDCWRCHGAGSHRRHGQRTLSRPCRWCRGAGKRLRVGRRIANAINRRRA